MTAFFVGCDWGTTHLRLKLLPADGGPPVAELSSNLGVAAIAAAGPDAERPARFEQSLADQLRLLAEKASLDGMNAPIVISGMASASIGWKELPYAQTPWRLDGSSAVARELDPLEWCGRRQRVLLLSGLRTSTDVMRGEETQVLGLFQTLRRLEDDCIAILPGTHSKHVRIEAGSIVDFRTFMTGELFEVLGRHSVLRHSVAGDAHSRHLDSFVAGVELARAMPLSAALFRVRTRQVLQGHALSENRGCLSGILIGSELAALCQAEWAESPIVLAAAGNLGDAYLQAARVLGIESRVRRVSESDFERLASVGQACVARRLGVI